MVVRTKSELGRCWRRCFALVFLFCLSSCATAAGKTTVWIDTDPSIGSPIREVDDAFALILAFRSPELSIGGISSSYGNASLRATTRISRKLVRRFAVRDIPVYEGAGSPRDLGQATAATEGLKTALETGGRITYLALGPLTNLATFQMLHPDLARRIERVIFVGGETSSRSLRFGRGRGFQIHDANVFKDPTAVQRVMQSPVPITLARVESSSKLVLDTADFQQLRNGGPAANFLFRESRVWLWFWSKVVHARGAPLFDVTPVLGASRADLLFWEKRAARVDSRGRLIITDLPTENSRAVSFCSATATAKMFVVERLCQ